MPDPDPRVERLEKEIDELRHEITGFIRVMTIDVKELKHGVDQVNGHVADVLTEIGTVPDHRYRNSDRRTVTDRLHTLENDKQSARIAAEALKAAAETRAQAVEAVNQAKTRQLTRFQKVFLFIFAGIGALGTVIGIVQNLT